MERVTSECDGAKVDDNHVFAFCLLPLAPEHKHMMLHLMTHHTGNAGKSVVDTWKWLRECLTEQHFNVRFLATDGDVGYNALNKDLFVSWWPSFCQKGLESALAVLGKSRDGLVSDFLHVIKNARSRILAGPVTINPEGLSPFSAEDMNRVLQLGKALTDMSTVGKMKDIYPLQLFTLENFMKLVASGNFAMAFYVLPYALWVEVLRNPVLSQQTRIDLLAFVVDIFAHHHECLQHLDSDRVSQKKTRTVPCVYFCSTAKCYRMLNTVMILLRELYAYQNIALDRVGTHVLECNFGIIRLLCQYKHSWNRIWKSFSQLLLISDLTTILGSPITPRARVNDGGVKLHDSDTDLIHIEAPNVRMREVYDVVNMLLAQRAGVNTFGREVLADVAPPVAELLRYLSALRRQCQQRGMTTPKLWLGSDISNGTIVARLIAFTKSPNAAQDAAEDAAEDTVGHESNMLDASDEVIDPITESEEFRKAVTPNLLDVINASST